MYGRFALLACICACGDQKKVLCSLELELEMAVSCTWVLGTKLDPTRTESASELSFWSLFFLFHVFPLFVLFPSFLSTWPYCAVQDGLVVVCLGLHSARTRKGSGAWGRVQARE